jgi:4-amino-4-deoxy-L-arabinose transferase-like glycosyltransferase
MTKKRRIEIITLVLLTTIIVIPFINKPFHIDDPLFVWTAEHINKNFLDFYSYEINWYGVPSMMHDVMKNPPLISYIYSLLLAGMSINEINTHLIVLMFAILFIIGIYKLAAELNSPAFMSSIIALASPVFLISCTTVMSDIPMLCASTWGIYFWVKGLGESSSKHLVFSVICISIAMLTKYYGVFAIPILIIYTIIRSRKEYKKMLFMLVPLAIAILYEYISFLLYGKGLIINAAKYAMEERLINNILFNLFVSCSFIGGCCVITIPLLEWSSKKYEIKIILPIIIITSILAVFSGILWMPYEENANSKDIITMNALIFVTNGLIIIYIALRALLRNNNPRTILLCSWIITTVLFAVQFNWTINGRTILPMVPALSILVACEISRKIQLGRGLEKIIFILSIIISLIVSITLAMSDYDMARTNKIVAERIMNGIGKSRNVYFQGHWGFQYYMEKMGGIPISIGHTKMKRGDIIIIPENNTNIVIVKNKNIREIGRITIESRKWPTVMNNIVMAGFYSYEWGPLPYVYGAKSNEVFVVQQVN